MSFRNGIARHVGAALGLFAMLVVTLLAPVHQAHAAQRDLARASGELLGATVICHGDGLSQVDLPSDADPNDVVKCPICSAAKQVGGMPVPALAGVPAVWGAHPTLRLASVATATSQPGRVAQPRGPPIPV